MILAFFGAGVGMYVRKNCWSATSLCSQTWLRVLPPPAVHTCCFQAFEVIFNVSSVHQSGYICSMLFVIPGFPLITGGIDLAKLDLRSGLERITYALLIILMATITGWVVALLLHFSPADFPELEMAPLLKMVIRIITSFCGVYGFSLMFNSKRKMAACAGLIGMIANTTRLELIDFTPIPAGVAAFIGAMIAGLLASAMKSKAGYPRITLTVPSIVIMVPGMFLYKGIYYLGSYDISTGGMWLTKAFLIIISLPLGLISQEYSRTIISDKAADILKDLRSLY